MLWPRNDNTSGLRPGHFDNIAAATLLRNSPNTAMVPTVWHPLLNRRIDHDLDHLTWSIRDKESAKRLLPSIPGLPADQGPSLGPEALGTSQQPVLR